MKEFNEKTIMEMINKINLFKDMVDYSVNVHYELYNNNEAYYNSEYNKSHVDLNEMLDIFKNLLYLDLGKMTHQKLSLEKKE